MTIVLPALALAFAAFCVWLAVRIINRRERWAKWTAAVIAPPLLYLLSFGPACWIIAGPWPRDYERGRVLAGPDWFVIVYDPIGRLIYANSPISRPLLRFGEIGFRDDLYLIAPGRAEDETPVLMQCRR